MKLTNHVNECNENSLGWILNIKSILIWNYELDLNPTLTCNIKMQNIELIIRSKCNWWKSKNQ